jgi:hypothetical protein
MAAAARCQMKLTTLQMAERSTKHYCKVSRLNIRSRVQVNPHDFISLWIYASRQRRVWFPECLEETTEIHQRAAPESSQYAGEDRQRLG